MGAYQAAADLGLRIPEDLSIVGFDNQENIADGLRPGLTTMAYRITKWVNGRSERSLSLLIHVVNSLPRRL